MRVHLIRAGLIVVAAISASPCRAEETASKTSYITADDLQGLTIRATNAFAGRVRNVAGETSGGFTIRTEIRVGAEGGVEMKVSRNSWWDTPGGKATGQYKSSGTATIGRATELPNGNNILWILEGNTLTNLRILDVGAVSLKIAFEKVPAGLTCTSGAAIAQEIGAGATQGKPNVQGGGAVQFLSGKPTTSECMVRASAQVNDDDGFWPKLEVLGARAYDVSAPPHDRSHPHHRTAATPHRGTARKPRLSSGDSLDRAAVLPRRSRPRGRARFRPATRA